MLNSKIAIALAAAIVLAALYGCSSSGTKSDDPVVVPDPPDYTADFITAQDAKDNANSAAAKAAQAITDATNNAANLTTLSVAGDSATAAMNAQAVLDAQITADTAVDDAQAALDSVVAALAALDADPDSETKDAVKRALEDAMTVATDQLAAAKTSAEDVTLETAVQTVTGTDEENLETAEDVGAAVRMDIAGALAPLNNTDGDRARGTHGNTAAAATIDDAVQVNIDDHQGATWEEIVGTDNVTDKRITNAADTTVAVRAASLAGMPASSASSGTTLTDTTEVANGAQYADASYMGIGGTSFCHGDCGVDADGNLTGSWYFTPTSTTDWYVSNADGSAYVAETLYAQYGHWLAAVSPTDDDTNVNTYAMSSASNSAATDITTINDQNDEGTATLTDTSATYSGTAAGISVTDSESGRFTATVNLTATFGANAMLAGTVSDFEGVANPSWTVELQGSSSNFDDGTIDGGNAVASGRDGEWDAQAYGETGARPAGIYGGFNAHFSDGHAAGGFATRKD